MAVKSIRYLGESFNISYEIINPQAKVDMTILHGWGSSKEIMKGTFGSQMQEFRHIYIDLPGFGKSTAPIALTTKDVAKVVELFMISINAKRDIILGHSFGGKVALLLHPTLLVLVASAGIYIPKSLNVRLKIATTKLLNFCGLSRFRSLFVAEDAKKLTPQMYETFKNVVNEDFSEEFRAFQGKALICFAKEDTATPLSSGEKIAGLIEESQLEVYEGDHFFFIKNGQDIAKKSEEIFLATLGK